jgi:hypothetical protein
MPKFSSKQYMVEVLNQELFWQNLDRFLDARKSTESPATKQPCLGADVTLPEISDQG